MWWKLLLVQLPVLPPQPAASSRLARFHLVQQKWTSSTVSDSIVLQDRWSLKILKGRRTNELAGLQTKPSAGQMFASGQNAVTVRYESKHSSAEVFDSSGWLECFTVVLMPSAVTCTSARGSLSARGFGALVRDHCFIYSAGPREAEGEKNRFGLLSVMSCQNIGLLNWLDASYLNFMNGDAHVVVPYQQGCWHVSAHTHLSLCILERSGGRLAQRSLIKPLFTPLAFTSDSAGAAAHD